MTGPVRQHGKPLAHLPGNDPREVEALLEAVRNNCECSQPGASASVARLCGAHGLLLESQRVMDGLVFERRDQQRLLVEEWRERPGGERP